jgi:hypothetical protein
MMAKDRAPEIAQHFVEKFFPLQPRMSDDALAQAIAVEMCDHFPEADDVTILKAMEIVREFPIADDAFDNPEES